MVAVTVEELTRSSDGEAIMSRGNYNNLVARSRINVLRPGKGAGSYALIEYASLPQRFKDRWVAKYGDPEDIMMEETETVRTDTDAQAYYDAYTLPDGSRLPLGKQREYTVNASVLGALAKTVADQRMRRRMGNNSTPIVWGNIVAESERLRAATGHTLPKSEARLREKLREFGKEGYACLVSGKFGNANTVKITEEVGRQIIALRRSRTPIYSTRDIFEKINGMAKAKGWKQLRSESSVVSYLERPEVKPKWYDAVYGELAAKQVYSRHESTVMPSMRDSLWYGDGTKLNLYYRDYEDGRLVVKTAYVYEVADAMNDTLLGHKIGRTENFLLQYGAFREAVTTSGHRPFEIVTDNQGGQKSKIAQKFFKSICHIFRTTAPYNPQSKTIERLFGRFQQQVLARDWRFTGQNVSSKNGWKVNREFLEANKADLYTFDEMCAAYEKYRREWNDMVVDRATGMTRLQQYQASVNPEAVPVQEKDVKDMFWIWSTRAVPFTADGIAVQHAGVRRRYEVLDAEGRPDMEWRKRNTGRPFLVRFDPDDMGRVELFEERGDDRRYVATAYPYVQVHRNIQEQSPEEMAFIRANVEANKRLRVERQLEAKELEMAYGVAPEQNGLRSPALKGLTEAAFEELADTIIVTKEPEKVEIGPWTKDISNMEPDDWSQEDALSRL